MGKAYRLNEILSYARASREVCEKSRSCKTCPGKEEILYFQHDSDLKGCKMANNLLNMGEDYKRDFGIDDDLDSVLSNLAGFSKVEGILKGRPNKYALSGIFRKAEAVIDKNYEDQKNDIEIIPEVPKSVQAAHISRKAISTLTMFQ